MFCKTHSNTSGKPSKRRKVESVKQKCTKRINGKAKLHDKLGPNTTMGGAQAQPPAHLAKAVARRASQGAVAP